MAAGENHGSAGSGLPRAADNQVEAQAGGGAIDAGVCGITPALRLSRAVATSRVPRPRTAGR